MPESKTKLARTMRENVALREENARLRRNDLENELKESRTRENKWQQAFGREIESHAGTRKALESLRAELRAVLESRS